MRADGALPALALPPAAFGAAAFAVPAFGAAAFPLPAFAALLPLDPFAGFAARSTGSARLRGWGKLSRERPTPREILVKLSGFVQK